MSILQQDIMCKQHHLESLDRLLTESKGVNHLYKNAVQELTDSPSWMTWLVEALSGIPKGCGFDS